MHNHSNLLHVTTVFFILGLAPACTPTEDASAVFPAADANRIEHEMDAIVMSVVGEQDAIRSIVFGIYDAPTGFQYLSAAGVARSGAERVMTTDHQFMIASVSKTIVATRILQMSETGKFELDDKLSDLPIFQDSTVVEELHLINGKSFGADITVRQLLQHTSGMKDYLLDDSNQVSKDAESGVAPGSLAGIWQSHLPAFLAGEKRPHCNAEDTCEKELYPDKNWAHWNADAFTANRHDKDAGLLNYYLSEMAESAVFPPGEGAHYSDTNYLILGLLIEAISGESLDEQLQTHIFKPLHMSNSYMSYAKGHENVSNQVSDWYAYDIPMVTVGANVSWDWAGGGIVTTAEDLLAFIAALMKGELYEDPDTLAAMLDPIRLVENDGELIRGYGLGIRFVKTELGPTWGHTGAWGAQMHYFQDHGIFVVGTVNDYGSIAKGEQTAIDIAKLIGDRK